MPRDVGATERPNPSPEVASGGVTNGGGRDLSPVGVKRKRESSGGFALSKISRPSSARDDPNLVWDISKSNTRCFSFQDHPNPKQINTSMLSQLERAPRHVYATKAKKKGEGTFGVVYGVTDCEHPEKQLVMKIAVAELGFFSEVMALERLKQEKVLPNVPQMHQWFISDQLPPSLGNWTVIRNSFHSSSQFRKSSINSSNSNEKLFGYLIMESAEAGTMRDFFRFYMRAVPSIEHSWYTLDVTIFQLLYSMAALPQCKLLHRDLGGSNNILMACVPPAEKNGDHERDESKWCFGVGDIKFAFPRPAFKPLIIDYGTAKLLNPNVSFKIDFRFTTLRYRAPELIFISETPRGELVPRFTPMTDLFSIGMTILEIVMGEQCDQQQAGGRGGAPPSVHLSHPFMRYKCPDALVKRLSDLVSGLQDLEDEKGIDNDRRKWARMLRKGFLDKDEVPLLARYLWGMYHELGTPSNEDWAGIENTGVWKCMHDFMEDRKQHGRPVPRAASSKRSFLFTNPQIKQCLSADQVDMLSSLLHYDPKQRPDPLVVLQSGLFEHLRTDNPRDVPQWKITGKSGFSWGNKPSTPKGNRPPSRPPGDRNEAREGKRH